MLFKDPLKIQVQFQTSRAKDLYAINYSTDYPRKWSFKVNFIRNIFSFSAFCLSDSKRVARRLCCKIVSAFICINNWTCEPFQIENSSFKCKHFKTDIIWGTPEDPYWAPEGSYHRLENFLWHVYRGSLLYYSLFIYYFIIHFLIRHVLNHALQSADETVNLDGKIRKAAI